jgi:hypothetical protein
MSTQHRMTKPSHDLYQERMKAIGLAIKAVREAAEVGAYIMEFERALNSLRLARLMTFVDYRQWLKVWQEEQEERV